jgi:DnaK suppressor protein
MNESNFLESQDSILKKLEQEEKRIRKILLADAEDFEELQSEWQERDSPAERNLREVEWNQYASLQNELSEIEEAKQRLADNTYGICEDCEKEISAKRLLVVPTAKKCISCQEKIEKEFGIAN